MLTTAALAFTPAPQQCQSACRCSSAPPMMMVPGLRWPVPGELGEIVGAAARLPTPAVAVAGSARAAVAAVAVTPAAPTAAAASTVTMATTDTLVEEADRLHAAKEVDALFDLLAGADASDDELAWRIARAHHDKAEDLVGDDARKEQLLREGLSIAEDAKERGAGGNGYVLKWYAILLGRLGDFLPTKEKVANSYKIKDSLEASAALLPEDASVQVCCAPTLATPPTHPHLPPTPRCRRRSASGASRWRASHSSSATPRSSSSARRRPSAPPPLLPPWSR